MAKRKTASLPTIKRDARNVNRHNARSKSAVKQSLAKLGAGRSILVDADNTLIAGECTYEQASALKLPLKVVETDGRELVVVKRTDLRTDDPRRRALAIADNKTATLAEFDLVACGKELKKLATAIKKAKLPELPLDVTGFSAVELEPLLAPAAGKTPPKEPPDEKNKSSKQKAAAGAADSSVVGRQSDGRAIFFGQDQVEIVNRFIAYAHEQQGSEASDAECIVWGLLQLLNA